MAPRLDFPSVRVVHNERVFLVRFRDDEWYDIKERVEGTGAYGTKFVFDRMRVHSKHHRLGCKMYKAIVDKAKELLT